MKRINYIYVLTTLFFLTACKEDFLEEKPIDFLSSSNAMVSYDDFVLSVNDMYRVVRTEFYTRDENRPFDYIYSTDLVFDGQPHTNRHTNMTATFDPSGTVAGTHWDAHYRVIAQANTIISRTENSSMTAGQKEEIWAKAKFFRAFSYRTLAYLYGGVPLVLEEITSPKTDFVRASKQQVYEQCIIDLTEAVNSLPGINSVKDGEINKQAAQHLLAEIYLAAGQYQNAVSASTAVIESGVVGLMRNRFGRRSTFSEGNVYWDLFQPGNQNRAAGNLEALWVIQIEPDVPGGSAVTTAQAGSYLLERHHAPYVGELLSNGVNPFLWPVGNNSGGRGIGWAVSTPHFGNTIWERDFDTDIRNDNINFVREFISNNPNSPLFGQKIVTSSPPSGISVPSRGFYPYQAKCTHPGQHPANLVQNAETGLLRSTAGGTYTDQYMFRLAETYLIRAEAYLESGDAARAAADLNTIRSRSEASDVLSSEVNLDFILDERMRELGVEEKRKLTLMRLGVLYDRVQRYNPHYTDVNPRHNLWPIPFSEIERNKDAVLEQNPGYN